MSDVQLRAGDAVRIRGERWRIAAESSFDGVAILDVEGCDVTNLGATARFIRAFERIDRLASRSSVPRVVTLRRWRSAACATLAGAVPHWASLRAAARAELTILPFQLEPAIAVTRGDACRILIADEVGLGKTIQAGLIVAETILRTPGARVLIVSPAGLREQWRGELDRRFNVSAEILDAEGLARAAAQFVADVNPWSLYPVAITSIDFIKRPEVVRSLEALTWDLIVFDEAHVLAGRSDRAAAATALAQRARTVVMLTATPHSGDGEAFARLSSLGDIGGSFPLLTFHRTRRDVGVPHGRRLVQLRIRPTIAEDEMHRALERYVLRLKDDSASAGGLVASILTRRASSSASSLARSVERRIALLTGAALPSSYQMALPLDATDTDEQPGAELGAAALSDSDEEMRRLNQLLVLSRAAAQDESKLSALRRLIRRAAEPVLVFTEYRDTLQHLAVQLADYAPVQLHGGMSGRERLDILRQFAAGTAAVLLATDAASEGLNLHHRCRLVVNLELPWTPPRLEQRIGRVDRLGQSRRVHAVQFIASSTAEESLVLRLDDHTARIEAAFSEQHTSPLRDDAEAEARRLRTAKLLAQKSARKPFSGRPLVTFVKRQPRATIWIVQYSCLDATGRAVFDTVGALSDTRRSFNVDADLLRAALVHQQHLLTATATGLARWLDLAIGRERWMLQALRESQARLSAALLQPGLFDRRVERAAAAQSARLAEAVERSRAREAMLEQWRCLRADDATILLGIAFRA